MSNSSSKSFTKLLDENAALKLLLEEAHVFGNHAWSCATVLKTADGCDCWFGKSAEMLIDDLQSMPLTVSLKDLECKGCSHKALDHTGRLSTGGPAVCCICNCPCLGFKPKEVVS